ncbi:molybdopterin converting factor subunit 1 [soil metagenome]
MRVALLYFAGVRDVLGTSEEAVTLPATVRTVDDLRAWLVSERPLLAERMGHIRLARNERFAEAGEELAEGDVIALIPPVAGG